MASEEANAFFEKQKEEKENRTCFECNSPNTPWCDLWHCIYLCLQCSGKHRNLGTHISFVRSLSMDGWPEERLRRMALGGNARAKRFLREKGVADKAFHEKWNSNPSFMYKDMITAELEGRRFNESTWTPPPEVQRSAAPPPTNARPDPASIEGSRYQGIGSQRQDPQSALIGDTGLLLSTGWSKLSEAASVVSKAATDAAVLAAQKSKSLAEGINTETTTASVTTGWTSLASATSKGWGSLSKWAQSYAEPEDNALTSALSTAGLKQGTQYSSLGSQQVSPPPQASPVGLTPKQSPSSPLPKAPSSSPLHPSSSWDKWEDEDEPAQVKNSFNSKPVESPITATGGSSGASLSSMKRTKGVAKKD